jgi:hypothetical protein
VLPAYHAATGLPVDVVLAGPGPEERFLEGVVELRLEGEAIPVPRVEDLVVMKVLAARPKDLDDVVAILAARPTADITYARDLLAEIEAAIDQSDLVPALDAALARARRRPTH